MRFHACLINIMNVCKVLKKDFSGRPFIYFSIWTLNIFLSSVYFLFPSGSLFPIKWERGYFHVMAGIACSLQ